MTKIEHIGISVADLAQATPLYEALLGTPCYKTEEVSSERVRTAFFKKGDQKIELLEAANPESAIAKYVAKKGEGIHHIAFAVDDIFQEVTRLKNLGFKIIDETPKPGADNKLVVFLHPKSCGGVLVELCQERNDQ